MATSTVVPGGILPLLPHYESEETVRVLASSVRGSLSPASAFLLLLVPRRSEEKRTSMSVTTYLFFLVGAEQPCVMSLLNHDECNTRLIGAFETGAGLAHRHELMGENVRELSLADAVAVENDTRWFEARRFVELNEKLADHGGQFSDHLVAMHLDANGGSVARRMRVHGGDDLETNVE